MHNFNGDSIIYTALRNDVLLSEIEKLCKEAIKNKFAAVCVPPLFVLKAKEYTEGSDVKVSTVVGFPLGYSAIESKLAEILLAIVDGVDEVNMVVNITALKNNDWQYLANEINSIIPIVKRKGKTLGLIIETGILTNDEIIKCCDIYGVAGIDHIQTCTGFSGNVTINAVKLIRGHMADAVNLIAAGDIKSYSFAEELFRAGADKIAVGNAIQILKDRSALN